MNKKVNLPSGRQYLDVTSTSATRPKWSTVAQQAIDLRETHDIKVRNMSDYHALRRSIMQAGYFVWRHHLKKHLWILRITETKPKSKENPLSRELPRAYRSPKFRTTPYGRWLRMTDELIKGKTISFTKRSDVTIMRAKLRQHKPTPPYPPYKVNITEKPDGKSWDVSLSFPQPAPG